MILLLNIINYHILFWALYFAIAFTVSFPAAIDIAPWSVDSDIDSIKCLVPFENLSISW